MSKIRLHGSSSGYTEIAPVAASGNNTLTLPNDGTILSKDSAGAVGVTSVVTDKIKVGAAVTIGESGVNVVGVVTASSGVLIAGDTSGVSGNADDLIIGSTSDSTARGLTIASTTNGNIRFSDAGDNSTGMIEYNHSSNFMRLYVEAGEALRIDSSRNLKFNSGYGSVETAYGVRAWVKYYWNSGTPTISGSGNVSSLTDTATGDATINFSTALPDTVYAAVASADEYGQSQAPLLNLGFTSRTYSTTAVTVNTTNFSGSSTDVKSVQVIVVR